MVAVLGIRFAPSNVSQAIVPNAAVTRHVTSTVTVTAAAPAADSTARATTPATGAPPNGAALALTADQAVAHQDCTLVSSGSNAWYDQSVSLDNTDTKLPAMTCRINWSGAVSGHLDFLVPASAHEFSAQVGIDRESANTTAQVRFDVLTVEGTNVHSVNAAYQNPQPIKVAVTGGTRIRLKVTLVNSAEEINSTHFVRVAWAVPAFG
ncbi:NPCBM/NEW2 domain-containing protein [Nonomuraea sp. NPDC050643]|uniref:NPCBM/NEW2 domain-containing protein n=1 Tax=Nonomuraea sp. NPDC050643 TaxID=3155660 RepID=UPI0033DE0C1D